MKKILEFTKAVFSPWLLLLAALFLRTIGIGIDDRHLMMVLYACVFWSCLLVLIFLVLKIANRNKR